jgi:Spy/CpxP family protein refolding chaperone
MQPSYPTSRAARRWTRRGATAALLLAGLALAFPAHARRDRGDWGGSGGWIERHAEELGLDEAKLAEIRAILDASRAQADGIHDEHRAARKAMHDLLDQDEPDRAAVMKQAEVLGEIEVRKHKHRLETMLKIREMLTPEQRAQLRTLKDEMRERRGERGKCGGHRHHGDECSQCEGDAGCGRHGHHGGECPRGDGPPAPAEEPEAL